MVNILQTNYYTYYTYFQYLLRYSYSIHVYDEDSHNWSSHTSVVGSCHRFLLYLPFWVNTTIGTVYLVGNNILGGPAHTHSYQTFFQMESHDRFEFSCVHLLLSQPLWQLSKLSRKLDETTNSCLLNFCNFRFRKGCSTCWRNESFLPRQGFFFFVTPAPIFCIAFIAVVTTQGTAFSPNIARIAHFYK